jgi:Na+(H+)/acetate symporter ActP
MFSNLNKGHDYLILEEKGESRTVLYTKKTNLLDALPKVARSTRARSSDRPTKRVITPSQQISSEEAIRAGEQIAMAAFASGLKLAAAFGTVAAKTAGLALASLASGADKFSELVREEAKKSYRAEIVDNHSSKARRKPVFRAKSRKKQA